MSKINEIESILETQDAVLTNADKIGQLLFNDSRENSLKLLELIFKMDTTKIIKFLELLKYIPYYVFDNVLSRIINPALDSEIKDIRIAMLDSCSKWGYRGLVLSYIREFVAKDQDEEHYRKLVLFKLEYEQIKRFRDSKQLVPGKITEDFRLLYHSHYWDGPLTGICLWNGKKCYFSHSEDDYELVPYTKEEIIQSMKELSAEIEGGKEVIDYRYIQTFLVERERRRFYDVYEIPNDMLVEIELKHDLFRKYVGWHCDYNELGKRMSRYSSQEYTNPERFYELYPSKYYRAPDTKLMKLIGEFYI